MGTHFLESPEDSYAKTQHLLRPEDQVGISPYAMRREQGDERHVLSPEDAVGETSYVVPTEGRAEEAGGHASNETDAKEKEEKDGGWVLSDAIDFTQ